MSKKVVQEQLEANNLKAVVLFAEKDFKVVSQLIRLAYDKESLVGWRAILATGLVARNLVNKAPDFLRETCRKLLWSLSDESGGIGWSGPELLGEIVSADPERFSDLIPLVATVYDTEGGVFRAGTVYALARIAEQSPRLVAHQQRIVISSLVDADPLLKLRALDLTGSVWSEAKERCIWSSEYQDKVLRAVESLFSDRQEAWIYQEAGFINTVVSEKAKSTHKKLI